MADYVQWEYLELVGPEVELGATLAAKLQREGYEVKKIFGKHRTEMINALNYLGALGWELVTSHNDSAGRQIYVLKRQRIGAGIQDTIQGT